DAARRLGHLEPAAMDDGQARRVVAAIFQPVQSLDQDGCGVPLAHVPNDSAHVARSLSVVGLVAGLTVSLAVSRTPCAATGAGTAPGPRTCGSRARPRSVARSHRSSGSCA